MTNPTASETNQTTPPSAIASVHLLGGFERQHDLLKRSEICRGASDDDITLFIHTAQRTGLDPWARQIYMRWNERAGRMQTLTTIDGYRAIADRTGELDGQDAPMWCGDDKVWHDVWTASTPPVAARIVVYRKGITRGFVGVARFASYVVLERNEPTDSWKRMPDVLIAKCAEALALRKAFPNQLGGLYTGDEMDHVIASLGAPRQGDRAIERRDAGPPECGPTPFADTNGNTCIELDSEALAKLFKSIANASSMKELGKHLPTLRKLVLWQKRAARVAWRAKRDSLLVTASDTVSEPESSSGGATATTSTATSTATSPSPATDHE